MQRDFCEITEISMFEQKKCVASLGLFMDTGTTNQQWDRDQ